jgi:twitching motility two-component system response regulator PilH
MARVLLLEDDIELAAELQLALTRAGHEVVVRTDGREGFAHAATHAPELIVLSAELSGVSGFRLANLFKKDPALRSVPLFLVAREDSASAVEAHQKLPTCAERYLRKPLVFDEFLGQVRAQLAGRGAALAARRPASGTRPATRPVTIDKGAAASAAPSVPAAWVEKNALAAQLSEAKLRIDRERRESLVELGELESKNDQLVGALRQAREANAAIASELEQARTEVAALEAAVGMLRDELARTRDRLNAQRAAAAEAQAALARTRGEARTRAR